MKSTRRSSLTLDLALPGAIAFATERGCAVPSAPYDGFNACFYTGDDPAHTSRCRAEAAAWLSLPSPDRLIMPRQTHSDCVATVDASFIGRPLEGVDALVTADPSIAIGVSTADCLPLLLSDGHGRVAAIHSGWRGTVARIAARAVEAMTALGARPADICAAMGPVICADCFEVGPEVAEVFAREFPRQAGEIIINIPGARPHIDLARAVAATLIEAGVREEAITFPAACSRCAPDRFFSARRLGIASGRTLTAIRATAPAS